MLGHDRAPTGFWDLNLITEEPLKRCPVRLLQLAAPATRQEVLRWKEIYFPLYKKGHLLVPGGIANQPARWVEAMCYLESLETRMETKYLEIKRKDAEGSDK